MIQKNDFIEIVYTGKTKDEGIVFDTTDEKTAKDNSLEQENASYGPVIICVGQSQLIGGLDKNLVNKEPGKEYTITLQPEEAFGKKSAKLIHLVPTSKFKQNDIMPQPGLQVNIDGMMGIVKTVSGGRTLVDFNHPLSGKVIEYTVRIIRKVEDDKEKLVSFLQLALGAKDISLELKDGKAEVQLKTDIPNELSTELLNRIKELVPSIKELKFIKPGEKQEPAKSEKTDEPTKK